MKKIIIHTIPVAISWVWLIVDKNTFNPISLKGPDFLKFYLILLLGFYSSVFLLKSFMENISKATFYFMTLIFALGIVKLIRGIMLGKPIGFLMVVLIMEILITVCISSFKVKDKIKYF
ncbi:MULTISPECIES: hypothetical protein [Chryseobacterium]|uniref:Uncharacterized protein n=1 Tax=Chryseobacterium geocarposphaerae TaxID=1416776 RepID=A0ABU1LE54_9FLAO|nr:MULTISPECIES: hypothetical protein [Chryseobacterium]MDR6404998.1 hypothetical protein [Chryseobacterium geocarposphaerae]MDR6697781.1 hypothetical protein [Chryseobacterium ginsenosidimutans]